MATHIPRDRHRRPTMGLVLADSSTTRQLRWVSNSGRVLSQLGKITWSRTYVELSIVLLLRLTLSPAYPLRLFNRSLETLFQRVQLVCLTKIITGSVPLETQAMVSTAGSAHLLLDRGWWPATAVCFDLPSPQRRPQLA
jgi:hypothetical protein